MRTSSLFAVGALSLAALAVNACGGDDDPSAKARAALAAGCSLNSDCNDPLACVFQRCHEQCSDSRDCPSGSRCVQGEGGKNVCQLPDDATCKTKSDCPGKQLCGADSQCRDGCASEGECVTMQKCAAQGVCAETTELDPSGNLLGKGGSGGSAGAGGSAAGTGGSTSGSGGTSAGAGGSTAGAGGSMAGAGGSTGGAAGQGGAGGAAGSGGCADGFADCDSTPGCETNLNLLTSCGSCTNVCGTTNAQSSCDMGTCKITSCSSGFADCDKDAKTGCESPVSADPLNCGACGRDCKQATCAAGFCGGVVIAKPTTVPSFNPNSVVATETNVFLIHIWGNDSRVMRFPIEPTATSVEGKEIRKVSTAVGGMNSTQIEGDSLYWVEKGAPSTIFKYPADGTDVTPMGFFTTPSKPERLEVKATAFYWVDEDSSTKQIWTRQKDGQGNDLSISVRPGITSFHGLIVGTTHLAWIERVGSAYNLMRAQLDGSNVEKVDVVTDKTILADTGTELVYTVYLASPNGALKRQPWAAPVAPAAITLLHQPYAAYADGGSFLVQVDGGADVDTIFRIQPDGTSTKLTKLPGLHYFYNKPGSNFLFYRLDTGPTSLYRTVK